jgi:hypothetical protein
MDESQPIDDGLEMVIDEIERLEKRLFDLNSRAMNVIQFIVLVFGAVGLAAIRYPVVGCSIAVFWGAWFLYAAQIDRDTMKWDVIARLLERRANSLLLARGVPPLFVYRDRLAHIELNAGDKLLYFFPQVLAMCLQLTATVAGAVLVEREYGLSAMVVYLALTLGICVAIVSSGVMRAKTESRLLEAAKEALGFDDDDDEQLSYVLPIGSMRKQSRSPVAEG